MSESNDYPKRRRWDGDRGNLGYEVGDDIEDGEPAVVQWVDDDGAAHTEGVEIGAFEPHNSWLSMFAADGSGKMYFARPDRVLLRDASIGREVDEIGEVKRVVKREDVQL